MRRRLGEAPKQRHVDGRVELRDRSTRDTKPFGRLVGTADIQPLGSLKPIAEMQRVFVEAEMLQHKAQRAGGRVLAVEMMVVEVGLRRVVVSTDIDDRYRRVIEVVVGWISPEHRGPVPGYEYADGQEVVFMGAAGMRDNGFNHAASQHTGSGISMMLRDRCLVRSCTKRVSGISHEFGGNGMEKRCVTLAVLVWISVVSASSLVAQTETDGWPVPRTADGRPDLSGVWDFQTLTPLQRPQEQEARLTEEEAVAREQGADESYARANAPSEIRTEPLPAGQDVGGYNRYWLDQGARVVDDRRTSLIVDPSTGRVPELKPGALRQVGSLQKDIPGEHPVRYRTGGIGADGPEDRGIAERCIVGFNSGPPILPLPGSYNQNFQLFQTRAHVAILTEMVHEARIIPLDGRPPLPRSVRQWLGDGRGHWDGDTLVIDDELQQPRAKLQYGLA